MLSKLAQTLLKTTNLNNKGKMTYKYLGDRLTEPKYKGQLCNAVKITDKCIRGRNGNFLVQFESGENVVVLGRLLRKIK